MIEGDVIKLLKKTAEEFDLKFDSDKWFKFMELSNRDLTIRDFLSTSPTLTFVKYRRTNQKNRNKTPGSLVKFLASKDYEEEIKKIHACMMSRRELNAEIRLVEKIPDEKIKKESEKFYKKIKKKIGKRERLTLIWKTSKKDINNSKWKQVLLHEFVHELIDENNLRPRANWKWNEGLAVYLEYFSLGGQGVFESNNPVFHTKDKIWNACALHAHKWFELLKNAKTPVERRRIILKKIGGLNGNRK